MAKSKPKPTDDPEADQAAETTKAAEKTPDVERPTCGLDVRFVSSWPVRPRFGCRAAAGTGVVRRFSVGG